MPDIVAVRPQNDLKLWIEFENGESGMLDVRPHIKGPVFLPLLDEKFFARVRVDEETGTIAWPNGADLCSDVIYYEVTSKKTMTRKRLERLSCHGQKTEEADRQILPVQARKSGGVQVQRAAAKKAPKAKPTRAPVSKK
jgi:hypothetical protein